MLGLLAVLALTGAIPRFGTATDLVNVTVSVTDENTKQYVGDLSADSFALYENGIRQRIELFERQALPIDLVLMIDVSGSMGIQFDNVRHAATEFTRTLRPEDRAEILAFSDHTRVAQDFTGDHTLLEKTIKDLSVGGETQLYTALYVALHELGHPEVQERRKVIVLLTDGEDTGSLVSEDQVIEAARRSGVLIYAIKLVQPEPLAGHSDEDIRRANFFLSHIAQGSGGQAYKLNAPLALLSSTYQLIAQELQVQYRLGYVSSDARRDGKWRTVSVLINGKPGLTTHHRLGYYAPKK